MSIKPLRFSLNLYDRASPGLKAVSSQLATVNRQINRTKYDMRNLFSGIATTVGAVMTGKGLVGPAREMQAAQGELATLFDSGMNDSAIATVSNMALAFSEEFGIAASSVVTSAYDIQSAISGLSGVELSAFTRSSALLARATKADTSTITGYMGTMNNIFAEEANRLGNAKWVEQIAGQTAAAVRQFKTDGNNMSAAFSNLGARASNQGISAAEQFSVVGMLQATMGGSNAGTAYGTFMDQIAAAQDRLKMNFSGEDGRALGLGEIINQLRERFGGDWNTNTAGIINQAFGSTAGGLIQNLWNRVDELNGNIAQLGSITNASVVEEMARNRIDVWDQLSQAVQNVRVQFGASLNDAIRPFINYLIGGAQTIRRWIEMFPNLTKMVAFVTLGIIASTGAVGAWMAVTASARIAMVGLSIAMSPIAKKLLLITAVAYGAYRAFMFLKELFGSSTLATVGVAAGIAAIVSGVTALKGAFLYLSSGMVLSKVLLHGAAAAFAARAAITGFWSALVAGSAILKGIMLTMMKFVIANPIVLFAVAAIGIASMLWKHWDAVMGGFRSAWGSVTNWMSGVWETMSNYLWSSFQSVIGRIAGLWDRFTGIFSSDSEKIGVDMEAHQQIINGALPASERPLLVDSGTQANQRRMGELTSSENIGGQTVHVGSQKIYVDSMTTPEQMNLHNQMGMPY